MQYAAAYSNDQLQAIEAWLKEGLSTSSIAAAFARQFHIDKSRNAIIGIIHRQPALSKLMKDRAPLKPGAKPTRSQNSIARREPRPKLHQHPSNIRGKLVGRSFDPGISAPAKPVDRHAYDLGSKRLPLESLGWRDCRFPVNDAAPGETHLFCGMRQRDGSSYCAHHCDRTTAGYSARAA